MPISLPMAAKWEHATSGRMRLEGADYVVQDGDVMRFRFNV